MFTQAGSMLLFLSVFFGEGPRTSHEFYFIIEDTIGIDSGKLFQALQGTTESGKWNTLHFSDMFRSTPKWIYIGPGSMRSFLYEGVTIRPIGHPYRPPLIWHIDHHFNGALILGEPDASNP